MEQVYSKAFLGTVNRSRGVTSVHPTPKSLALGGTQENACPPTVAGPGSALSCVSALKINVTDPYYLVKDYIISSSAHEKLHRGTSRKNAKTPKATSHNRATSLSQAVFLWQKKLK